MSQLASYRFSFTYITLARNRKQWLGPKLHSGYVVHLWFSPEQPLCVLNTQIPLSSALAS
ncbi:hypothetical protein J6590_080733 [Homalodisca vitripennis]|nr:hypothetical protein J6590_080733 [Homalodisca vitripennis]